MPTDPSVRCNILSWENAADRMGPTPRGVFIKAWSTGQLKDHLKSHGGEPTKVFSVRQSVKMMHSEAGGFFFFFQIAQPHQR